MVCSQHRGSGDGGKGEAGQKDCSHRAPIPARCLQEDHGGDGGSCPMNPHPAAPSPANLTAAQGRPQRWLGPDVPIPQEKGLSALEQRSGLKGPLCTEAGPPARGFTTERLPRVRLRQGFTTGAAGIYCLGSALLVVNRDRRERSGIYSRGCCGKQLPMLVRWDSSVPGWRSPRPSPSRGFPASDEVWRVLRMQN